MMARRAEVTWQLDEMEAGCSLLPRDWEKREKRRSVSAQVQRAGSGAEPADPPHYCLPAIRSRNKGFIIAPRTQTAVLAANVLRLRGPNNNRACSPLPPTTKQPAAAGLDSVNPETSKVPQSGAEATLVISVQNARQGWK